MKKSKKENEVEDTTSQNDETENNDTATTVEEVDEKLKKIEELEDKYLRLYSEFENYRRRTAKEKLEMINSAGSDVLKSIIPVIDDFERAIKASAEHGNKDEGITLIYNKLISTLQKQGLEKVPASVGEPLNVEMHEAITKIPAPDKKLKGKIVDEVECAYKLNGKIIRYAKVVIGE